LSVSVKWLAVKTASKMTYTVSGGALNSAQPQPPAVIVLLWALFDVVVQLHKLLGQVSEP